MPRRSRLALTLMSLMALLMAGSPALAQSSAPEPQITSRQEGDRTLREYRVNGALYAIEVRSSDGTTYYLVDPNGDGNFERRDNGPPDVPGWVREQN